MTASNILALLERIPVWKKLIDLPKRVDDIDRKIVDIENKLSSSSEIKCPACGEYKYFVVSSIKDKNMGDMGTVTRKYKCKACGFSEDKTGRF